MAERQSSTDSHLIQRSIDANEVDVDPILEEVEVFEAAEEVFGDDANRGDNRYNRFPDAGRMDPRMNRQWNELFSGNRRPENGVAIAYSAPVVRSIVDFTAEDVQDSIDFWKFVLIGTVFGARIPVDALKRFVSS